MKPVFLALGSNLNDPIHQVTSAIHKISQLENIDVLEVSSLYASKAYGVTQQPDFINAVIKINTKLNPLELLRQCKTIEHLHQRKNTLRWRARTLDIDIILYGNAVLINPELTIPHYDMLNRDFVITPLLEIEPLATLPDGTLVKEKAKIKVKTITQKLNQTDTTSNTV
jgi:2-amino-4-hydroxy-6-hydroxymethyldihydropteridine diphosphokinase